MKETATNKCPGVIESGNLYTVREFAKRMKIGSNTFRNARKSGLKVRYLGRRPYVLGADVLRFFLSLDEQ
jgi:hypothetical protein